MRAQFYRALGLCMLAACGDAAASVAPILQRPTRARYECSFSQPLIELKPRRWGYGGHAMASAGEQSAWIARVERMGASFFTEEESKLIVSKIDASGVFSSAVVIPLDEPTRDHSIAVVALVALDGGAHTLIWNRAGEKSSQVQIATITADGNISDGPKTVDGVDTGALGAARATTGKIGLVWSDSVYAPESAAHFVSIDESGTPTAEPKHIAMTNFGQLSIAPSSDGGFALAWKAKANSEENSTAAVFFAQVNAAGTFEHGPVQLTEAGRSDYLSFARDVLALQPTDYGYLLAWTEGNRGQAETGLHGGYSMVRMLRVDRYGHALGPVADVRSMEEHIDEVEPSLIVYEDAVGLLWSRGSHIYLCGGCVPDHSVEFVLLDPVGLYPVSNVVRLPPPSRGGLLGRSTAVVGTDILMATDIQFHVHSEPGFAAISCDSSAVRTD